MRGRSRVALWLLAGAAALAALIVFGLAPQHTGKKGRAAPQLPREHLAGPPATLASLLRGAGGRPSVVVFWASWCTPCAQEAAEIERFSQAPAGRGRIVGVDWSDALGGARAFIRRHAWTFSNLRDAEGTVGNAYRMTGLPTSYVLDADGHIRQVLGGPQTQASLERALTAAERS